MSPPTSAQRLASIALLGMSVLLAVPLIRLVEHRSQIPAVLGRYSLGYLLILIGYALVTVVAASGTVLMFCGGADVAHRVAATASRLRRHRVVGAALIALPWLAVVAAIEALQPYAPGRSALVQLPFAALALWLNGFTLAIGRPPAEAREAIARLAIACVSLALSLGAAEVFLRTHPDFIPNAARYDLPGGGMFLRTDMVFETPVRVGFRYLPNQDVPVIYRRSDGDLYHRPRPSLPAVEPRDDAVLAQYQFTTDENGYSNPSPLRDHYDVVTAGDSFTAPSGVATPWPRVFETRSGRSVLNLAIAAYGPQQEAAAVHDYGLARHPALVILAYFEGNDLMFDAPTYAAKQQSGRSWVDEDVLQGGPYARFLALQSVLRPLVLSIASDDHGPPRFPIMVSAAGRQVPIALFDPYLSGLTATRGDIEASTNFAYVRDVFVDLQRATAAAGASFLVVYVPSKEHVYAPLITDAAAMQRALAGVAPIMLFPERHLGAANAQATPDQVWSHRDDQRDAIVGLAAQLGIDTLDLTPAVSAEAARGTELYYLADTHWNQRGHDFAGRVVAAYVHDHLAR